MYIAAITLMIAPINTNPNIPAKNINVNAIAPGAFSSEMMDGMIERVGDISQAFPRKRIGLPEQMDSTLLFLVSPSSECVTGTCIKIDDGQGSR